MLEAEENSSKLKPLYLFQASIENEKPAFFLITDSDKQFWMKQEPTDWKEVTINSMKVLRDGGSTTYSFSGKEYGKLYIPSPLQKDETPCVSGNCVSVSLEKIPLSKEILKKIGITNKVELDLSYIPETIISPEKGHTEKLKKRDGTTGKNLLGLFHSNPDEFFDALSEDTHATSAAGVSTVNDITKEVTKLKM